MTLQILPIFEGCTVDLRLKQFRKITKEGIIFIDFDSIEGEKILLRYIEKLDPKSKEFENFIHYFNYVFYF